MYKVLKIINYIVINSIRLFANKVTQIVPRNKNIWLFNCVVNANNQNAFTHNTKFLYLYISEHPEFGISPIWISTDKNIIKILKQTNKYDAVYKYSLKGIWLCLRAKYYIINLDPACNNEISQLMCGGATIINLWHGIPLKSIGLDVSYIYQKLSPIFKKLHKCIRLKANYYITNYLYDTQIFKKAFDLNDEQLKILGSPRLDTLFSNFNNENLFMENDVENILKFKEQGKKLLLYVPTYRDTGKDISNWIQNPKLLLVLKQNNAVLICKLHPVDANAIDINNSETFYKMSNNSDINAVLKYTDALITDYSSINFDYTLLDRPIIYFVPDFEEYQLTCHKFYTPYKEFAIGDVCKTEDELLSAMQEVINGIDNYKEQRKILRDKIFKYQDGKNCERVIKWIKSLDEKGK